MSRRSSTGVFGDIVPDAVKIGMLSDAGIIASVAERLKFYNANNIVVDPVMVSTSGSKLLSDGAADCFMRKTVQAFCV